MEFLFWSQIIFWLIMIVYIYYLNNVSSRINRQLESLIKNKRGDADA